MKQSKLLFVLIPALAVVGFALFIQIVRYKPLYPKQDPIEIVDVPLVPVLPADPILGDRSATQSIVVFEDFGCEGCKTQTELLEQLIEKHPKQVKVIWKGIPATQFPHPTRRAHEYAYCAHQQQKFDTFKDYAFANLHNLSQDVIAQIGKEIELDDARLQTCLASPTVAEYIETTENIARSVNVIQVPAIFINNVQQQIPSTLAEWETILGLSS